ncbi:MAG: thioredoxin-dependent thiol peroxidase [Actinobacteria bacterium]|nr:thioredoxin-dependent thiol peroxidase [Actinomycetota bacterium]
MAEQLDPGDPAPDFALANQDGETVRLSDYRGRKLLLYFYPAADTPGCTKQSCDLRDSRQDLVGLGVDVVGISPDESEANKRFDEKYALGFPLLSDPDNEVTKAYGCWGEKSYFGEKFVGLLRSSFLIDEEGRIEHAWYRVKAPDTAPKALEALSA